MKKLLKTLASALLISCFFVSMLSSCTIKRGYEGAPENMRPITDGSEGAIVYVPIDWTVDTSTGVPSAYYSNSDYTMITLTTVTADKVGSLSPLQYYESQLPSLSTELKEFEIIKKSDGTKNYESGMMGGRTCYTFEFTAKVAEATHKFSQTVVDSPTNGNIFILTYSAHTEVYDSHYSALTSAKEHFTFVEEPVNMVDKYPVTLPSTEGVDVPNGFKLVSNSESVYYLFVPESWKETIISGMTAANSPESGSVSVNALSFSSDFNKLEDFWDGYKADLSANYHSFTPSDPEFTEVTVDGYRAHKYIYTIVIKNCEYRYEQYAVMRDGYVHLVTFCCRLSEYTEVLSAEFDSIISVFKFKV